MYRIYGLFRKKIRKFVGIKRSKVANETHRLGARMRELKALKRSYQPLPNPSYG